MGSNYKNKVFIQIFLSFFLLFFLVLIGFAYNESKSRERELNRESEKFIGLILKSSEANMGFLKNYVESFKNNTNFLEYITSKNDTPLKIYEIQRHLAKDENLLGKENVELGIINLDKKSVVFSQQTYNIYDYQRIVKLGLFDVKDSFVHLEGNYFVKYIPFKLSENSDRIIFVLKIKKEFLQSIFQEDERVRWFIREENSYLDVASFSITKEIADLQKGEGKGILEDDIFYTVDRDRRSLDFEMFWKLLLGLFIINGISYLLATLIFKLTYNPLEESLGEMEDVNAKHIHEYLKLKELLSKLKKENSLVEKKLESSNLFLNSRYLKEFIQGIISFEVLNERITEDRKILGLNTYQLILIKRTSREEVFMRESDTLIRREIERLLNDGGKPMESLDLSHNISLYLGSYDETRDVLLDKMIAHFNKKYSVKLEVIVGGRMKNLLEIQREYQTVIKYFDYSLDSEGVITKENIEGALKRRYYYPLSLEQELVGKISKGELNSARGLAIKVFYENHEIINISEEEQETLKVLMLNSLRRIINTVGIDDEKSKRIEQMISRLNLVEYISFEDEYLKTIENIVRIIGRKEREEEKSDLKEKIEEFIRENYTTEISLQDLADHIGYSQHYMSHVFKGLFKDSFRSKINSYRIKRAKEIMSEERNIKVYELAKRVGYSSSSSFIKIFKSVEGYSPGAYKERIK